MMLIAAVEEWTAHADAAARAGWIDRQRSFDDDFVRAMKQAADQMLEQAPQRSFELGADILEVSYRTGSPLQRAWGEMACGNALLYLGRYREAITRYDAAQELCLQAGEPVEAARSQIGKSYCLMVLAAYDEGLALAMRCYETLAAHGAWRYAARAANNAANILQRQGRIEEALVCFEQAEHAISRASEHEIGEQILLTKLNRAILELVANRYRSARATLEYVYREAGPRGYPILAARAALALARIGAALGNYNQALVLFEQAQETFAAQGMFQDVLCTRVHALSCALALNLHERIIDETAELGEQLETIEAPVEQAQVIYARSLALLALGRVAEADMALARAGALFAHQGSQVWLAWSILEQGRLRLRQADSAGALALGLQARAIFQTLGLPIDTARAQLVIAGALRLQGAEDDAIAACTEVLDLARADDLPWVAVPAAAMLAELAEQRGRLEDARALYVEAITAVERMRQRVMFEYRSSFLEDKEALYAAAARVSLALDDPRGALSFAERGKSRTLFDLLAGHIPARLRPRSPGDRALLVEIERLREELSWYFNQLHRRPTEDDQPDEAGRQALRTALQKRETELSRLLDRLHIHNADYTHDTALFLGPVPAAAEHLPPDVALVEYYLLGDEVIAFVQEQDRLDVVRGLARRDTVERWLRAWRLNLAGVRTGLAQASPHSFTLQTQRLLARGYDLLLRPLQHHLEGRDHLVIVPHGLLHYLPFHALFDGTRYLIERMTCSYLPAGHLLPLYAREQPPADADSLVLGFSMDSRLPSALSEAHAVAYTLGVRPYLEAEAVRSVLDGERRRSVIHIATHAEFRSDTPIFSALCLADGPLTAADIFGSNLPAGLMTLSACETGALQVGGGDELVGLIRACLYAGADSVLLSHWQVYDDLTMLLMERFYSALSAGMTRARALQSAQRSFLETAYAHPYHWAAFQLIGAWGPLPLIKRRNGYL